MKIKSGILILATFLAIVASGCQNTQTKTTTPTIISNTPTEAYKNLFAAVKSKDTQTIKQIMSKTTQQFAESAAQTQKITVEEMYKNGLFESTMTPNLPPMRDERVKDNFGAVEVRKPDGNWEDVPFVKEDGSWKIAVGDVFKNEYKSPGQPASQANANTQVPQIVPMPKNANINSNLKMIPGIPNAANANVASKPSILNKSGKQ